MYPPSTARQEGPAGGPQAINARGSSKIAWEEAGGRKAAISTVLLATKMFHATEASWRATSSTASR